METTASPAPTTDTPRPRGAYSIGLLFYLTTLSAIVAAICRFAFDNELATVSVVTYGLIGFGIAGGIAGSIIGFRLTTSAGGLFLGLAVGAATGALGSAVALIQTLHYSEVASIAFAGCWALIVITLLIDRFRTRDGVQ